MTALRAKLIRLAHENPEFRDELLPLLKSGSSPDQWETGAKLIHSGAAGQLTAVIAKAISKIEGEFKDAERVLARHQKMGVGNTETPSLLLRPMREIKSLRDTLDNMLKSALAATGGRESDL